MSLSTEQIALLQDAAKYIGKDISSHLFEIPTAPDEALCWMPHLDRGDLYDLMAAGKVYFVWWDNSMQVEVEEDVWLVEKFTPNNFHSQAWAVITVCAMAQRRKGK